MKTGPIARVLEARRPWKGISQCELSTVEILSAFDPVMSPLGCSYKEITQNMGRVIGPKIFMATLFLMTKIKLEATEMPNNWGAV